MRQLQIEFLKLKTFLFFFGLPFSCESVKSHLYTLYNLIVLLKITKKYIYVKYISNDRTKNKIDTQKNKIYIFYTNILNSNIAQGITSLCHCYAAYCAALQQGCFITVLFLYISVLNICKFNGKR